MNLISILLSLSPFVQTPDPESEPTAPVVEEPSSGTRSMPTHRQELADIRLLLGARRDYRGARERLSALAQRLRVAAEAEPPEAGAPELLAEVEALDLEVRRALGEVVEASHSAGAQDKVYEAVLGAIESKEFDFVMEMGQRAVPALEDAIRAFPDSYPRIRDEDPLWYLRRIDPLAFSQAAEEQLSSDSFFWKKRVMRVIEPKLAGHGKLWSAGAPPQWLGRGVSQTAEKYVEDSEVGADALLFLLDLASRGERSSVLDEALANALRSPDAFRREATKDMARKHTEVVRAATFESLLEESESDLRSYAADVLVKFFPENRVVIEHVDDSAYGVRFAVAYWLSRTHIGSWGEEERSVLARLLRDAEAKVREVALDVLENFPVETEDYQYADGGTRGALLKRDVFAHPMPDGVYRALLGKGFDGEVGAIVVRLPAPLCFELAEVLATSPEPRGAANMASGCFHLPYWKDPDAMLRIVDLLLANEAVDFDLRPHLFNRLPALGETPEGMEALVRWVLAQPGNEAFDALVVGQRGSLSKKLDRLEPDTAIAFFTRLYSVDREAVRRYFSRSNGGEPHWRAGLSRASRGLAQDPSQPVALRILALNGVLNDGDYDEDFLELIASLLEDPIWEGEAAWEEEYLFELLRREVDPAANPFILKVLQNRELPESMPILAAQYMRPEQPGAEEIIEAVVERGFESEPWSRAVSKALSAMSDYPALQDPELLARAAWHPRHLYSALNAIRKLRDPRYLPLLTEIVAAPRDASQLKKATEALFGYLDAGAVEPLLAAAARVEDSEVRDQCLAHLEKIREYQDAKERWATRQVRTQTREQVIAQLVTQLDDPSDDVKVQAIRALATWEAVEVMPELIELTTSGSKAVSAAARESLERLNTSQGD